MKYLALMFFVFVLSCSKSVSDEPNAPHNSAEWQIWAYSTAAPSYIGDYATIIGGDGSILREGSNGWTLCQEIQGLFLQLVGIIRIKRCLPVLILRQ